MEMAEVRSCDYTIGLAIERIAGSDRLIDDLGESAAVWSVSVEVSSLENLWPVMVRLLESLAESRSTDSSSIELISVALNL